MSDQTTDTTQQTETTTAPEGRGSQASGDGKAGDRGSVPYSRFSEVYDGWKASKAEIETLRSKLGEADQHRVRVTELESEIAKLRTQWDEERVFTTVGLLDGEAQDLARWAWGRLADDQKPAGGMASWLSELRSDPSKAPRALSPYLSPQVQPEKPTPKQAPPQGPGPSRSVPAPVDVTASAIREAAERGRRSGDWSAFETLKTAVANKRK